MPERLVVNASPLIFLGSAGLLHLFPIDGSTVVVTESVWAELCAKGSTEPAAALAALEWCRREADAPVTSQLLTWDLGPGETSVIAWAIANPGSGVVIDDLEGRRCARSFGLPLRGTLGIVLDAHRRGIVSDPRAVLESLRSAGMWLSDAVLSRALREIGID